MKKLCSFAFATMLAMGCVLPSGMLERVVAAETTQDVSGIIAGSKETLQDSSDVFYALSLLSEASGEAQLKNIEDQFLPAAIKSATSARASVQDIEKLILLVEGLGYDATAFTIDGKSINLFQMMESKGFALTNDYAFALEAWHAANKQPSKDSAYSVDHYVTSLLAMRNPKDNAWNYNGDYSGEWGSSDVDTTAMVLTSLAPYATNTATAMGISESTKQAVDQAVIDGFAYLSNLQKESGAMDNFGENACSTSMVIIALSSYGKDVSSDVQFVKNGKTLRDGLLSFQSDDGKGFISAYAPGVDVFTTEQALRALLVMQYKETNKPYYLYQAGAMKHQNRWAIPEVTPEPTPETKPEPKPEAKPEDAKDSIIKATGTSDTTSTWLVLVGVVTMACFVTRKKA